MSFPCKYDSFSPCEECGRCNKRIYKVEIDEKHNEEYYYYSDDNGITWHEREDYDE